MFRRTREKDIRFKRSVLIGLAVPVATVPVGIGMAASGATITRFHSVATVTVSSWQPSQCPGPNGPNTVVRVKGQGPIASDDPRLAGTFHVDAVILVNAQGDGVSRDNWRITDTNTGALKAHGTAIGVQHGSNPVKSLSIGQLADGTLTSANAVVSLPPPGTPHPITIAYGGSGSPLGDVAVTVGLNARRSLRQEPMTVPH